MKIMFEGPLVDFDTEDGGAARIAHFSEVLGCDPELTRVLFEHGGDHLGGGPTRGPFVRFQSWDEGVWSGADPVHLVWSQFAGKTVRITVETVEEATDGQR